MLATFHAYPVFTPKTFLLLLEFNPNFASSNELLLRRVGVGLNYAKFGNDRRFFKGAETLENSHAGYVVVQFSSYGAAVP